MKTATFFVLTSLVPDLNNVSLHQTWANNFFRLLDKKLHGFDPLFNVKFIQNLWSVSFWSWIDYHGIFTSKVKNGIQLFGKVKTSDGDAVNQDLKAIQRVQNNWTCWKKRIEVDFKISLFQMLFSDRQTNNW